ncbi:hypothetical protein Tco_0824735 [Tanacetum coccineum]|uniref:Uncharacterized protein n=1 Tax=Tanacetum coccineum TaxID=301880 RepID=A0ABQ5AMN8_9ASTR
MVINSLCLTDKKELAIPGQTMIDKEFLNPLMAGSLPKTICAKVSTESVGIPRKLESSSYHALGACLRPYNAFLRRCSTIVLSWSLMCLNDVQWSGSATIGEFPLSNTLNIGHNAIPAHLTLFTSQQLEEHCFIYLTFVDQDLNCLVKYQLRTLFRTVVPLEIGQRTSALWTSVEETMRTPGFRLWTSRSGVKYIESIIQQLQEHISFL